jgi:acyl dehydratase
VNPTDADALPPAGSEMGVSEWLTVTQDDIDLFARATHDQDPMHVDPDWCREAGPFPTTVAFGFLSLSLITHFSHQARAWPEGAYALNYGLDRVRFVAPVPVGSRIRGRFTFRAAEPRLDGSLLTRTDVTVEIGVLYPPEAQRKMSV